MNDKSRYYAANNEREPNGDPTLQRYEDGVGTFNGHSYCSDYDIRNFGEPSCFLGGTIIRAEGSDDRWWDGWTQLDRAGRLKRIRETWVDPPAYFVRLMVDADEEGVKLFAGKYTATRLQLESLDENFWPFPWAPGTLKENVPAEVAQLESLFAWMGAKSYLRDQIVAMFPPHHTYCEPFCGSMKVLLWKKSISKIEIVNDVNQHMVNFWRFVREHPVELAERINSFPTSEYLFKKWSRETKIDKMTPFMQAVVFYYIVRLCFNAKIRSDTSTYGTSPHTATSHLIDVAHLKQVSQRLRSVDIRCNTFDRVIKSANKDLGTKGKVLFYCDPPYYETNGYHTLTDELVFGDAEQTQLRDLLTEVDNTGNFFIMTNSLHPFIKELYSKFPQYELDVKYNLAGGTVGAQESKEILVTNFDISQYRDVGKQRSLFT